MAIQGTSRTVIIGGQPIEVEDLTVQDLLLALLEEMRELRVVIELALDE